MEKPDKAPVKTNSSVPDIVFYQLKMDGDEKVIGFIDNDSEEQFGRLARKGGEILLPGVFPQKAKEEVANHPESHGKKEKIKVRVDIPTSDTDLETLMLLGPSSSDLKLLKSEDESIRNKVGSSDNEASFAEKDNVKEVLVGEINFPDVKTFAAKKSHMSGFSNDSHFSRSENCDCCKPVIDDVSVYADGSESVLQTQQFTDDRESMMEEFAIDTAETEKSGQK